MKLVAAERGRFVALFPVEEVRPIGGIVLAEFVTAISERYQFLHFPSAVDLARSANLVFKDGGFSHENNHLEFSELGIFGEGVAVEARTTEIAELLMQDFLGWAKERFQLRELTKKPRIFYNSQIVVDVDVNLNLFIRQFDVVKSILLSAMTPYYGDRIDMEATRVWFSQDQRDVPQGAIVLDFGIERRANVPFGDKRLYCVAPLPTGKHMELIQHLEDTLGEA